MTLVPLASSSGLDTRIQIVAVIATAIMLGVILELVRRRRLVERYALLWMSAAIGLLVLAVWRGALNVLADALGIAFPPNALFLVAFSVTFVLLLHFSIATSRLSEETKILAQEVARLDQELRSTRTAVANGDHAEPAGRQTADTRQQERAQAPSSLSTTDQ